ncbi:Pyrimidine deaminase [Candidatus Burkholderia verschuerenii]|uniref:Pyrimidine deaminase n=1 Tax=Candidatus Burkholderia verschuerenii TaxID=242163 RepID=A0A0L0LWL2_9BURK|nr:PP0621 family protein [Candidatus Burkholderia verschuerenii]KND54280.1 Pyrimidine deaminase [Candidatus Burkholderia verschuerenii]
MRNFILLIVIFFATQWLLKKLRRANARAQAGDRTAGGASARTRNGAGAGANPNAAPSAPPQLADPLVRCAQCGVHMPSSDAIVAAGQCFCSAGHARRYAARPTGRDAR